MANIPLNKLKESCIQFYEKLIKLYLKTFFQETSYCQGAFYPEVLYKNKSMTYKKYQKTHSKNTSPNVKYTLKKQKSTWSIKQRNNLKEFNQQFATQEMGQYLKIEDCYKSGRLRKQSTNISEGSADYIECFFIYLIQSDSFISSQEYGNCDIKQNKQNLSVISAPPYNQSQFKQSFECPLNQDIVEISQNSNFNIDQIEFVPVTNTRQRRMILVTSMLSMMMIQTLFLNVENILPLWVPDHVPGISALQISFIISAFEFSQLVFSPFIGKYLDKVGRKNTILIGHVIAILSTAAMGATKWLNFDKDIYLAICILLRFILACYAIVTYTFKENREKYIGMTEAMTGLGLMFGPILGSAIYTVTDYFWTFIFFAGILTLNALFTLFYAPKSLNHSYQFQDNEIQDQGQKIKIGFQTFLKNKRCMMSFLSCIVVCQFMTFSASFIADVLEEEKDIPEQYIGLVLALPCLTYIISSNLVSKIMRQLRFPRRLLILVSFLLLAISTVLQGPSLLLGIPDSNTIMMIGFGLSGLAQGFIFIPLLPDAIEAIYIKEKTIEGFNDHYDQLLMDLAAGIYGTVFSIGQILAPIVGGAIYDTVGYRKTTDIATFANLGYCLIFFFFNVGFKIFTEEKLIRAEQVELKYNQHQVNQLYFLHYLAVFIKQDFLLQSHFQLQLQLQQLHLQKNTKEKIDIQIDSERESLMEMESISIDDNYEYKQKQFKVQIQVENEYSSRSD